jgi:hypothetical protein
MDMICGGVGAATAVTPEKAHARTASKNMVIPSANPEPVDLPAMNTRFPFRLDRCRKQLLVPAYYNGEKVLPVTTIHV